MTNGLLEVLHSCFFFFTRLTLWVTPARSNTMAEIVVIHVAIGLITDKRNGSDTELPTGVLSDDFNCTSKVELPEAMTCR